MVDVSDRLRPHSRICVGVLEGIEMNKQPEALRLANALEKYDICASNDVMPDLDIVATELRRLYEHKICNEVWLRKTEWVQETSHPIELGIHRADALKQRIDRLHALNQELVEALDWIGARCAKSLIDWPLHSIHREAAHDAGACARAALAKASGFATQTGETE